MLLCNAAPCGRGSIAPVAKIAAVGGAAAALAVAGYLLVPTVETALSKVSTDYAYVIPYAAMSDTSLNCWKLSVIKVFSCSACLVGRPSIVSWMAA